MLSRFELALAATLAFLVGCPSSHGRPDAGAEECADGGCEDECRNPREFYLDADSDGFGSGAALVTCDASPPRRYTTTNSDCDDQNASVNPSAAEICDGIDQDCDGTIDNGFMCVDGDVRACDDAAPGGCEAELSQGCVSCEWQACQVVEGDPCDRLDNDCDGFVDEGGYSVGPRSLVVPLDTSRIMNVSGDYNPARREIGILFSDPGEEGFKHTFARLDAETGALNGSLVTVATGTFPGDNLLVFDGQHWTAVVQLTGPTSAELRTRMLRIHAATAEVTNIGELDGARGATIARLGYSGSRVVVAWWADADGGPSGGRFARFEMPASSFEMPTSLGDRVEVNPESGSTHRASATGTRTGALVSFSVTNEGTAPYDLYVAEVTPETVATFALRAENVGGAAFEYEPTTDTVIGVLAQPNPAGGFDSSLHTFDSQGLRARETPLSGPSEPLGYLSVYSGEPGQVSVFSGMFLPARGEFGRVRVNDHTPLASEPLVIEGLSGVVGVPEGPVRMIYFEDDGEDLYAYPVLCSDG